MATEIKIVILGAGGHARVVAQCVTARAREDGTVSLAGFIDPFMDAGTPIEAHEVLGGDDDIARLISEGLATHFIIGLGTVKGGSGKRREMFNAARRAGLEPVTIAHPSAVIAPYAALGLGTIVMPGAVINTGAKLGDNVIINTRASVDHDCNIGDDVHIAPGCVLSGNVTVGERSHIGVGSCAVQGVTVGKDVTAGAGTVIIKDVDDGHTVVGAPQRIIRT